MENKTFIIAELSANHNNDLQLAKDTIYAMKESGADAVKFQTFTADSMTLNIDGKDFEANPKGAWAGRKLYDLYQETSLRYDWQIELSNYALSLGIQWFSSPFDFKAVDFLESINCPIYKIASFEILDIPLIEYAASKGKPMIISTGIAIEEDIKLAIETCKKVGNNDITILKCTSAYPAPYNEINLNVIPALKEKFNVKVGLSDHTMGSIVPLGAVSLGARVVEKHFILDRKLGGADSSFSMNPEEFTFMVKGIRQLEQALGTSSLEISDESKIARERGRSLYVSQDVKKGDFITKENIRSIRPAYGLHPKYYQEVLNKTFKKDIKKGTPLSFELIN
ncbi:pseudaminic acid synthase [Aquimarina sp. MMG016]|uniref:pseudaminic acid synthase n=1 Tax=Aquimarina sp. MMG016 TaxID=2822690 RepID=UPI001B39E0CA|nr:pseudaminic acid synthase [Aquimarina sp. MMG016]